MGKAAQTRLVDRDGARYPAVNVLIVDDHAGFRCAIRDALALGENIRVVGEAESGEDCIEQVRRGLTVDVVLMDISMPGMSGIDTIRELMSIRPGLNVTVLTMHDRKHYRDAAIAAGAKDFVLKGGPVSDLEAAIERVAGRAGLDGDVR